MLFAQPKYKCLTGLRKERQTAKQMIFLCGQWRACTPIDKHKKTTEAKCLLSFTFLQWGSNGEAEARIPLKINIMLFAQPKYKCLTGLRKERQAAKQMIFCVGNGGLARQLTNIKNQPKLFASAVVQKKTTTTNDCRLSRDPAGARTRDPNIKSVVLYLLSYRINARQNDVLKSRPRFLVVQM